MKMGFSTSLRSLSAFTVVSLLMILSCSHEDEIDPEKYKWIESALTPADMNIILPRVESDGELYALGWKKNDGKVVAKFKNGAWETMAVLDGGSWISNFTVLNDTVYYATETAIRRARNDFDEQLLETSYGYLETYQGKVFIVGRQIRYEGVEYSLIAYDGHSFQPIDQEPNQEYEPYSKTSAGKLFISGNPMKVYDGTNLSTINFWGGFANIDDEGSIYNWVNPSDSVTVINKLVNGKLQSVGKEINTKAVITRMEFAHSTVFVKGKDPYLQETTTFYLDRDDEWHAIRTPYSILFLVNFEGDVYANTFDGRIIQLVPNE